jgi:hypothetical protein
MLNEIPARLRAHADRLKADAEAARTALAAFERERLVAGGAAALEAKAADAKAALDAAEAKLATQREELTRLDEAHAKAVESGNSLPEAAVSLLAEADAQQDLRELYREAQRTATPADEAILRRIEATDQALLRADREVRAARDQILVLAQRRSELERARGDFRRRGYDGPWGGFEDNGRLQDTLGRVLTGALGGAVLGGILQDSWRPRQTPFDPDFGGGAGFPLPMPGNGGGWGGGSPGGSSGGMGGGDDGFSTGGSF